MMKDDQLTAARQSGYDTLCGMVNLTMSSIEKILALNLELSKATLETVQQHALDACVKKEPQQLVDLGRDLNEQVVKGAQNYNSAMMELVAAMQSQAAAALQAQNEVLGGAFQAMAGNVFRFQVPFAFPMQMQMPMQMTGTRSEAALGPLQDRVHATGAQLSDGAASKSARRAMDATLATPASKRAASDSRD